MTIVREIAEILTKNGADIFSFADLSPVSSEARHGFPFGISIGKALSMRSLADVEKGPTKEYEAEYERVNSHLARIGEKIERYLIALGFGAIAIPPTQTEDEIDMSTFSTSLPHKTVATLAGLGWIGKCALLVTRQFGSAVRLTTVLTDAKLKPAAPVTKSMCGSCTDCADACPAHAIRGSEWRSGTPREELVDVKSCSEAEERLTRSKIGRPRLICGICIASCPWTEKYLGGSG